MSTNEQSILDDLLRIDSNQKIDFSLIEVLAGERPGTPQEREQVEALYEERGLGIYSDILLALTHEYFDPQEAKQLFSEIIEHKWYLGVALRRNVGLKVATLDYLVNIRRILHDAQVIRSGKVDSIAAVTVRDKLTGLYDRGSFYRLLAEQIYRSNRYGSELSVIMLDVDYFKKINDTYGHLAANFVLRKLAEVIRGCIRKIDIPSRFGGEEFLICLPETRLEQAMSVADKLHDQIDHLIIHDDLSKADMHITISCGVANLPKNSDWGVEELIKTADEALFHAKTNGRNQVYGRSVVA